MKDKVFLCWLANRLVRVYGESPDADFVRKLVSISESMSDHRHTPNLSSYVHSSECATAHKCAESAPDTTYNDRQMSATAPGEPRQDKENRENTTTDKTD